MAPGDRPLPGSEAVCPSDESVKHKTQERPALQELASSSRLLEAFLGFKPALFGSMATIPFLWVI